MNIRTKQSAFHPNADRGYIYLGPKIFAFKRTSIDNKQTILCLTNLTSKIQYPKLEKKYHLWKNLINIKSKFKKNDSFKLKPFETMWLSNI